MACTYHPLKVRGLSVEVGLWKGWTKTAASENRGQPNQRGRYEGIGNRAPIASEGEDSMRQDNQQSQNIQSDQQTTIHNSDDATSAPPTDSASDSPGMLGAAGGEPLDSVPRTTAPIGVPTVPGGGTGAHTSAGTSVDPQAMSTASSPSSLDTYGTVGGISRHTTASTETGTLGIPGTPVPGPMRGDPTPPEMPNGVRSGARGADAMAKGLGAGVATGGTPASASGEEAGLSGFAHDTSTPVTGVTGANPDGSASPVTASGEDNQSGTRGGYQGGLQPGTTIAGGGADAADQTSAYGASGAHGLGGAEPTSATGDSTAPGELHAYNGPPESEPTEHGMPMTDRGAASSLGNEAAQGGTTNVGAEEDEVIRDYDIVTPEVTDMGLDERNRDRPDEPGWGRGGTPAYGGAQSTDHSIGTNDTGTLNAWNGSADTAATDGSLPPQTGNRGQTARESQARRATGEGAQTPTGALTAPQAVGQSTITGNEGDGTRAGSGAGMLNTDVPTGMAGAGPLGGAPARGDTADAEAWRRATGITAPSSAGSRGIHLGIGNNTSTGTSTPDAREQLRASEGLSVAGENAGQEANQVGGGKPRDFSSPAVPGASAPEFARHESGAGNLGGTQALNAGPGATENWRDRGDNSTHGTGRPDTAQAIQAGQIAEADRSGQGTPLSDSATRPTPEVGVAGGTGPAQSASTSGSAASGGGNAGTPGYPTYPTATGLPAGSGSGGAQPNINSQFNQDIQEVKTNEHAQ